MELKKLQDEFEAANRAAKEDREWDQNLIPEGYTVDPKYPDGRWLLSPDGISRNRGGYRYSNQEIPARRVAARDALLDALKGVLWGWGPCECCGNMSGTYQGGCQVACAAGCT